MMRRRMAPLAVIGLSLVAGCAFQTQEDVGQASSALGENAPIAPTFHADGDEDSYLASMDQTMMDYCLPFLAAGHQSFTPGTFGNVTFGKFAGAAGKNIAYGIYKAPQERAALVLVPGRTEPFVKYCEFFYDMRNSGISIYAMDIRGQGWSDRFLSDTQKGHIDSFDNYVADLKTFRDTIVRASSHPKTIVFGHSTGGGAVTLYLEKYPSDFDAAILHSPMNQAVTSPYPEWMALAIVDVLKFFGGGNNYAPGKKPYDENAVFADNGCEHSHERWTENRTLMAEHPELKIGGPTVNWVRESINATKKMRSEASSIRTPFLLLEARQDEVVVTAAEEEVCSKANRNGAICSRVAFGEVGVSTDQCDTALRNNDLTTANRCAGHELLFERDGYRTATEKAISDYIDALTGVTRN